MSRQTLPRISTVRRISRCGIFKNYSPAAGTLPPFARYNLVYGWNYSGKTSLSRVFGALEVPRGAAKVPAVAMEVALSNASIATESHRSDCPPVRVFNRDYVERTFHEDTDQTGAPAIVVLGEEAHALKTRRAMLTRRLQRVVAHRESLEKKRMAVQASIDTAATDQARNADRYLGERFRRDHLLEVVRQLGADVEGAVLSEVEFHRRVEEFQGASRFTPVDLPGLDHRATLDLLRRARKALRTSIAAKVIERLSSAPVVEAWVRNGLDLHGAGQVCEFCGSTVSAERWQELSNHFTAAWRELQEELIAIRDACAVATVIPEPPHPNDIQPELRDQLAEVCGRLSRGRVDCEELSAAVRSQLQKKLDGLGTRLRLTLSLAGARRLRAAIVELRGLIEEHNRRVDNAAAVKAAARSALIAHFAAEFIGSTAFAERQAELASFETDEGRAAKLAGDIEARLRVVDGQMQTASLGAAAINRQLERLLPGNPIRAIKKNDTDFEFQRYGTPARRMSDGERTAVAFAYFLASLESGAAEISSTIIVLDDPISSLDANHIYAVYGVLETEMCHAHQLFVLTHNAQFFGLVKDWMKGRDSAFFMTQRRSSSDGSPYAEIHQLPKLLKQFKSDYQYTFHCLKRLADADQPELEEMCGVPNMVRRFLEAYLGFIFPEKGPWWAKLPRILSDSAKCAEVRKFADDNSHSHSLEGATHVADYVVHAQAVVKIVLDAVGAHNPSHVASLMAELEAARGSTE